MPQRGADADGVLFIQTPAHLTPNILLSSMAAAQDVETRQMFLNSYVDGHQPVTFLIVTHYSSPGPSASQNAGRGCVNHSFV